MYIYYSLGQIQIQFDGTVLLVRLICALSSYSCVCVCGTGSRLWSLPTRSWPWGTWPWGWRTSPRPWSPSSRSSYSASAPLPPHWMCSSWTSWAVWSWRDVYVAVIKSSPSCFWLVLLSLGVVILIPFQAITWKTFHLFQWNLAYTLLFS